MTVFQVWKFPSPAKLAAARARVGSGGSNGSPGSSRGGSFSVAQRDGSSFLGRPKSRSLGRKLDLSQRVLRKHSVQVRDPGGHAARFIKLHHGWALSAVRNA